MKEDEKSKISKNLTFVSFWADSSYNSNCCFRRCFIKKDDNGITRRHTCGIYEPY